MNFINEEIESIDPRTKDGLKSLLEHLCGEDVQVGCSKPSCAGCQACMNWRVLNERLKLEELMVEDINDILLLVDQFPISAAFFRKFLSEDRPSITFDQLKAGITRFEGYAVLLFGNVRFAYRRLRKLGSHDLHEELSGLDRPASDVLKEDFKPRREPLALPAPVDKEATWLLGYIAKSKVDRDITCAAAMAVIFGAESEENYLKDKKATEKELYQQLADRLKSTEEWKRIYPDFQAVKKLVHDVQDKVNDARDRGWINTSHYLALDHMDVYVATSMREHWEFEDVNTIATEIFSHPALQPLKLRYFDPTQSFLENRVDKGLVEALMLKRARCTIYMAQETDTFGKDSELATTLAQGKPVIVFVPEISVDCHAQAANARPLAYLQRRLPQLLAEGRIPSNYVREVLDFLKKITSFDPYLQNIGEEESTFVIGTKLEDEKRKMCEILAGAERDLFNSRAKSLQKSHPLALQVRLESGVANGVLVVRRVDDCAELLEQLLTNKCEFRFDPKIEKDILCLIERISNCPFRVVTRNSTVSNSFWTRYLSGNKGSNK